jgi:hypothetical protein
VNSDRERIDTSDAGQKKATVNFIVKVVLVVAIFAAVFSLIYFAVRYGEANFVLSNQEITSPDAPQVTSYKTADKVHFYINRNMKNLDSSLFVMEIEFFESSEYKHYKQISFELDKAFPDLNSFIPTQYFKRPGKYRIKASLDGKVVANNEIEIIQ